MNDNVAVINNEHLGKILNPGNLKLQTPDGKSFSRFPVSLQNLMQKVSNATYVTRLPLTSEVVGTRKNGRTRESACYAGYL